MIPQLLMEIRKGTAGSILRTLANCVLPARRVPVTVLLGAAKGITMSLCLKREKYYWLGIHEYRIQKFLMEIVRPGSVFYDLGANIGFYSLLAARLTGPLGRCFAFEPVPSNIKCLRWNIELNQMAQIDVIPMAVSDRAGTAAFRLGANNSTGTLIDIDDVTVAHFRLELCSRYSAVPSTELNPVYPMA